MHDDMTGLVPVIDLPEEEITSVDKSYKLDFDALTISGTVDGAEAVRQAILKRLMTDANVHEIYADDYGLAVNDLIGLSPGIVRSELERRVTETLLRDDRITGISDFSATAAGDEMLLTFTVTTVYGEVAVERGYSL